MKFEPNQFNYMTISDDCGVDVYVRRLGSTYYYRRENEQHSVKWFGTLEELATYIQSERFGRY